uniref:NADH dehydrogenase subunit 2 n=1 Tax=Anchon yunnanense TaxID=2885775 RepID=UPI001EDD43C0|nr:NADH dehydrogenase subunit 2 [Anchon yunnanense]UKB86896.1 NADH dehydrogenase subunit 2 [Anchon yunnanense]
MFMNLEIMFNFSMMMGVIMAMSSNNWFSIWIGLEMSTMSFIPMMSTNKKLNSESCIKFFIVQSLSSSIMMMGVIMMSMSSKSNLLLLLAILLKLGVSPFHTWMMSIIEGMKYYSIFVLLTIMKWVPLQMMSYINVNLVIPVFMSLITGSMAGLNQNSIKKMITYSSIFNLSFMMTSIHNETIWLTYLMIYTILVGLLMMMVNKMNMMFMNQLMFNTNNMNKTTLWIALLALGGLPPMMGFFIKMTILKQLWMTSSVMLMTLMIVTSLIIMFFYMRMTVLSMLFYNTIPKWMTKLKVKLNSYMIMVMMMTPMLMFNLKSL